MILSSAGWAAALPLRKTMGAVKAALTSKNGQMVVNDDTFTLHISKMLILQTSGEAAVSVSFNIDFI